MLSTFIRRRIARAALFCTMVVFCGCSPLELRSTVQNKAADLFMLQTVTMPVLATSRPTRTQTASPTTEPSETARVTSSATTIVLPFVTPTIPFADISLYPESGSDFLSVAEDITIPDGTRLSPHEMFVKSWRLQNTGNQIWTDAYRLVLAYANPFGAPQMTDAVFIQPTDLIDFSISSWGPRLYNVRKGGTADLVVPLQAPETPGEYRAEFFLINEADEIVTPRFWIQFSVVLEPEQIAATETAVFLSSQTPDLTQTPTVTPTPEPPAYDWTGEWLLRDPFDDSAMNVTRGWLTQNEVEVKGFFYDQKNEPVLIEGFLTDDSRVLEGKFAWPWQNRAAPFVWRMLANRDQFYSVSEDGKLSFGSMCGGRNGMPFPEHCALPSGD